MKITGHNVYHLSGCTSTAISLIARAAFQVVKHIREKQYAAIIISGKSRIISRVLLEAAWRKVYPSLKMPKIFGFNNRGNQLLYKDLDVLEDYEQRMGMIEEFILAEFPDLNFFRDKKVCFVDDFINSGVKGGGLSLAFESLGFKSFEFAFFVGNHNLNYYPSWFSKISYIAVSEHEVYKEIEKRADSMELFVRPDADSIEVYERRVYQGRPDLERKFQIFLGLLVKEIKSTQTTAIQVNDSINNFNSDYHNRD